MGIAGLECYDEIMALRRTIFSCYQFSGLPLVDGPGNRFGFACLMVEDRERFCSEMAVAGIETNVMQVRNDLYEIFQPYLCSLPNLDWVESRYICIPLHNRMSLEDASYVAEKAARALRCEVAA